MAKLGTSKRPAGARVQTMERAGEIMALCEKHGWKVVVGIEPDKREDISDVEGVWITKDAKEREKHEREKGGFP